MGENSNKSNGSCLSDIIVAIIVMVILILIFRFVWHGVTWAFNGYVDLLRVH